jgi:hypothetical protein
VSTPSTTSTPSARPVAGSRAEREATQRWWLRWVYVPTMSLLLIGAIVAAWAGPGSSTLVVVLPSLIAGSLIGAVTRFRARYADTGGLALDEREDTSNMRSMGYGYCFACFGALGWAVAWVGFDGRGTPEPFLVLAGLGAAWVLGRLCATREGY